MNVLGEDVHHNVQEVVNKNYKDTVNKALAVMNRWHYRNLSLIGKLLIIRRGKKKSAQASSRGINHDNLIYINSRPELGELHSKFMTMGTCNARSIRNKDTLIFDYIKSFDLDLLCITETWLNDEDSDWIATSALNHCGYKIYPNQQEYQRWGTCTSVKGHL